jgi:hypothetical protein
MIAFLLILLSHSAQASFPYVSQMRVGSTFLLLKELPPGTTLIEDGQEVKQFDPNTPQVAISRDPRVPTVAAVPQCEIQTPKHMKAGTKLKMKDGSAGGIALDYELSKDVTVSCNYPPTEETEERTLGTKEVSELLGGYFFLVP